MHAARTIDDLSENLRRHVFDSNREIPKIQIKDGMTQKSTSTVEIRRKQGPEFWDDFREITQAVSGDDITKHRTTFENLEQKYNNLLSQTAQLKDHAQYRATDDYMDARINELQEGNERAWEEQMEAGKESLERMEAQLIAVQNEIELLDDRLRQAHPPDRASILRETQKLHDVLMLRAEEKQDLLAAIDAMKRTHADRVLRQSASEPSQELKELKRKRDSLRASILELTPSHNEEQAPLEEEAMNLSKMLKRTQETLEKHEADAAQLKVQMRKLVDVTAASRHVAAVILQVLFDHDGEWTKPELQAQVASVTGIDETQVVRALYSLLAAGLVHLDRSHAEGLVTSLLV
ncbi:hypothetical protein AC1031_007724 [Aphanomyces cochlioides]|nr:hypothetical protein AC1031_007724 [Aphanomyces cochlioides]